MKKTLILLIGIFLLSIYLVTAGTSTTVSITVGSTSRNMIIYTPTSIPSNSALVISMHGMNQDAAYQQSQAQMNVIADAGQFIIVYPNGINKTWDLSGTSDINFITAIIDYMYTRNTINKSRVYLSGFSMGGMMTYYAMTKIADKIAAFAPISGYLMGGPNTSSSRPIPIIHTHGTADDVVSYSGVAACMSAWVIRNGCPTTAVVTDPYPTTNPNSICTKYYWGPGTNGVAVVLMSLEGKGHWISIDPTNGINTSQEIWNFCKNYSVSSSSSSSSSSSGSIVSGGIYRITPRNGGKSVDVSGCATADGTNVQNWSWLNNNCQKWQFTSLTGGYWRISPMNATSKALDVSGVSTADGANVHIWAYGGGNNQQWQLVSVTGGYYQIVARHSGKCLDLAGGVTTDGANIQQWNCSGSGTNGHFTLTKLNSAEDVLTESLTGYMLYPSPVDDNLHITFNGQEKVNVRIYNNLGALALSSDFTGDTKTLDVSKLTSGMYFIRLEGNERTITDRFFKK